MQEGHNVHQSHTCRSDKFRMCERQGKTHGTGALLFDVHVSMNDTILNYKGNKTIRA